MLSWKTERQIEQSQMRRLIMSRLIWIYAVCKSLLLAPMAVKELNQLNETSPLVRIQCQIKNI